MPGSEYLKNPTMRTGESLLWVLGQSRRYSSRLRRWVVHAYPVTAAEFQRQVGCPEKSNIITAKYRKEIIATIDQDVPYARIYDTGRDLPKRNVVIPQHLGALQCVAVDRRIYVEFLARQAVANGVPGAQVTDQMAVVAGPIPNWEIIDGNYVVEDWDILGRRLVNARNNPHLSPGGHVAIAQQPLPGPAPAAPVQQQAAIAAPVVAVPAAAGNNQLLLFRDDDTEWGELKLDGRIFTPLEIQLLLIRFRAYDMGQVLASAWEELDSSVRRAICCFGIYKVFYIMKMSHEDTQRFKRLTPIWVRLGDRSEGIDDEGDGCGLECTDAAVADFLEDEVLQLDPKPDGMSDDEFILDQFDKMTEAGTVVDLENYVEDYDADALAEREDDE